LVQFIIEQQIIDFHVTNKQHTHLLPYNFSDSKQWLFFFLPRKQQTSAFSYKKKKKQKALAFSYQEKNKH